MHNNEISRIVFAEFRLLILKMGPMPAFLDLPFAPNCQAKCWFTDLHIAHSDLRTSNHIKRASEAVCRDDVTKPSQSTSTNTTTVRHTRLISISHKHTKIQTLTKHRDHYIKPSDNMLRKPAPALLVTTSVVLHFRQTITEQALIITAQQKSTSVHFSLTRQL